jgi:hypothetical protein
MKQPVWRACVRWGWPGSGLPLFRSRRRSPRSAPASWPSIAVSSRVSRGSRGGGAFRGATRCKVWRAACGMRARRGRRVRDIRRPVSRPLGGRQRRRGPSSRGPLRRRLPAAPHHDSRRDSASSGPALRLSAIGGRQLELNQTRPEVDKALRRLPIDGGGVDGGQSIRCSIMRPKRIPRTSIPSRSPELGGLSNVSRSCSSLCFMAPPRSSVDSVWNCSYRSALCQAVSVLWSSRRRSSSRPVGRRSPKRSKSSF